MGALATPRTNTTRPLPVCLKCVRQHGQTNTPFAGRRWCSRMASSRGHLQEDSWAERLFGFDETYRGRGSVPCGIDLCISDDAFLDAIAAAKVAGAAWLFSALDAARIRQAPLHHFLPIDLRVLHVHRRPRRGPSDEPLASRRGCGGRSAARNLRLARAKRASSHRHRRATGSSWPCPALLPLTRQGPARSARRRL